jgi:cytochrome c peroxidase
MCTTDRRWKRSFTSFTMVLGLMALSCSENGESIQKKPIPVTLGIPTNFPEPFYDLSANPLTEEGVALGKMLFYEPAL